MKWEAAYYVTGTMAAVAAIVAALWKLLRIARQWWDRRTTLELPGALTAEEAESLTRYYIEPDYGIPDRSDLDPRGIRQKRLFSFMDRVLRKPGRERFLMVLADSGMGKTAFLVNYYARYRRRLWRWRRIELKLLFLSRPEANEAIAKVPEAERMRTVLLLDALDEDSRTRRGYRQRLGQLIELSEGFRSVVITCRSQFFRNDEEIPTSTGVSDPLSTQGSKGFSWQRLYLLPFTDKQVEAYLRRRYRWGRQREEARNVVRRIPDLVARPLLLTYIDNLTADKGIQFGFQMYEIVVQEWCKWKSHLVAPDKLREFSECLAVEMFLARGERERGRVPEADLQPLAVRFNIDLASWQLRGRSLLNRDASGLYKFAHRSFLEYLFVKRFASGRVRPHDEPWTDLMESFLWEMMLSPDADALLPVVAEINAKFGPFLNPKNPKDELPYVWIPPQSKVSTGFLIGTTPVTVAAYRKFALETRRDPSPTNTQRDRPVEREDDWPAVNVSWYDATAYCRWAGGRLPSEAEGYTPRLPVARRTPMALWTKLRGTTAIPRGPAKGDPRIPSPKRIQTLGAFMTRWVAFLNGVRIATSPDPRSGCFAAGALPRSRNT